MFELRVLTGLHQGAVLPLIGAEWTIGSSDEMDLCLFDSGFAKASVELSASDQDSRSTTWLLTIAEGKLRDLEGHTHSVNFSPTIDVPFQLGAIWLVVSHTDTPWEDESLSLKNQNDPMDADHKDTETEGLHQTFENTEKANEIDVRESLDEMNVGQTTSRVLGYRNRILAIAGIFTAVVASSVLAFDIMKEPESSSKEMSSQIEKSKFDYRKSLSSPEDVRTVLKKMLAQRELTDIKTEIDQTRKQIKLKGAVDEHIQARFKRMLNRFKTAYFTEIELVDEVVLKRHTLPFKIIQIHAGDNGHIVTSTGQQLFVGDEVNGIRLLNIANNRIEFGGAQAFAVVW